jgi:GNAT superfamily N-acetyltransferase
MKIRRADRELDLAQIVNALDEECFPDEERPFIKGRAWWLACDDDGHPFGYAALRVFPADKRTAYLERAGVLPDARGRGTQRKLIRARLREARARGCSVAITYVAADNLASMNNLVSEGFRFYDPEYAWAGSEFLYLARKLA